MLHSRFLADFSSKKTKEQQTLVTIHNPQKHLNLVCSAFYRVQIALVFSLYFYLNIFAAEVGGLGGGLIHPGEYASAGQYFQ